MFRTKLEVRYCETDKMGIVHHSRYFPWFEVGRAAFLKSTGITYDEVEKRGVLFPLVDCSCKFIKSAVYGDEVWVTVSLDSLGFAKCKFSYQILRVSDGELLATGNTTHAFTNLSLKPVNLKKNYPELYQLLEELRGATS